MTPTHRPRTLKLASTALPVAGREQYLAEWTAESAAIADDVSAFAALVFRLQVLGGAPRLAFTLRSALSPGLFDGFLVGLTLMVPAMFFTVHAVVSGELLLGLMYFLVVVGFAAFARGLWSAKEGLFGRRLARFGLMLIFAASIGVPVTNRLADTATPMSDAPFATLPGTLITSLGTIIFLLSSKLGHRRVAAVHLGVLVLLAGIVVWASSSFANAVAAPTWFERVYHASIIPSSFVVAHGCMRIRKAGDSLVVPRVRDVTPKLDVIPHQ